MLRSARRPRASLANRICCQAQEGECHLGLAFRGAHEAHLSPPGGLVCPLRLQCTFRPISHTPPKKGLQGVHNCIDTTAIPFPHRPKPRLTAKIPARQELIQRTSLRRMNEYAIPFQSNVASLDPLHVKSDGWDRATTEARG